MRQLTSMPVCYMVQGECMNLSTPLNRNRISRNSLIYSILWITNDPDSNSSSPLIAFSMHACSVFHLRFPQIYRINWINCLERFLNCLFIALRTLYAEFDHRSKAKVRYFFSLHSIEQTSDLHYLSVNPDWVIGIYLIVAHFSTQFWTVWKVLFVTDSKRAKKNHILNLFLDSVLMLFYLFLSFIRFRSLNSKIDVVHFGGSTFCFHLSLQNIQNDKMVQINRNFRLISCSAQ